MAEIFTVSIADIVKELQLELVYAPKDSTEIMVSDNDCNRPGLQLMGFYEYFNAERIQICGNMEFAYLASVDEETRYKKIETLFATHIPMFVVARGHELYPEMIELAKKYEIPIGRTKESTTAFIAALISYLNVQLAPRITRHGVLIEIYGEGVLIVGESGVGKSETAIELVKRGHRLVADDAVEIRRVSSKSLVGSSPDNIRHFLEIRGIGIINVRRLFGMGAVKVTEKIDMVVELEPWDSQKVYDRMGVDNEFTTILGVKVPSLTIPIKPGRNLAVILEVAAMNNRQKKMGYNAAQAGAAMSRLCRVALDNGLSGLEFAYGIPGTVGGGIYMNAGAYGGEMKDVLVSVTAMDRNGELHTYTPAQLELTYRRSRFSHTDEIIVSGDFELAHGDKAEIEAKMNELMARRKDKQPLEYPNAGSTFKRPEGQFAGKLIQDCGLRGATVGGAQVSEKHCGFVINKGGATSADIKELIAQIQKTVYEKTGFYLECEVRIIPYKAD